MDTIPLTGRADLTDAQWAALEPLLPEILEALEQRGERLVEIL